ncbi:hypothetical protein FBU30_008061 [Linnemannia zychae]|nr:hypothetical protein FBU30_008061 [Linnemannia zychae]
MTNFDLVGPLGAGFSAVTNTNVGNSSSNNNNGSNVNNNNNNSYNNDGYANEQRSILHDSSGKSHPGSTNTKSITVRPTPLVSAKPDQVEPKIDPIGSAPGHNVSSFFGSNDPLMATDADTQPFFVDFDRFKKNSPAIVRELKSAATPSQPSQPQESALGMIDDLFSPTLGIASNPSRPIAKAVSSRERQLSPQNQPQQQQLPPLQRQTSTQKQHHDSSLDFFSSLETITPARSSTTSRTSPSASFALQSSNTPLPPFPTFPTDYSAFGRSSTVRKIAPIKKHSLSHGSSSTNVKEARLPLEKESPLSSPPPTLTDAFVVTKESEPIPSLTFAPRTLSSNTRIKNDVPMRISNSANLSKSSSSMALTSSTIPPVEQLVSKIPFRSSSSNNMTSLATSPVISPPLNPITTPIVLPHPNHAPKLPTRTFIPPQHLTPMTTPTLNSSAKVDSVVLPPRSQQQQQQQQQQHASLHLSLPPPPQRSSHQLHSYQPQQEYPQREHSQKEHLQQEPSQKEQIQKEKQASFPQLPYELQYQEQSQPSSRSLLSSPVPSQPLNSPEDLSHMSSQGRIHSPVPLPYILPPAQAPQFPSSPWGDDDCEFYQAALPPSPVVTTVKEKLHKLVEPVTQAERTKQKLAEPQPNHQLKKDQRQQEQYKLNSHKNDSSKRKQPAQQPQSPLQEKSTQEPMRLELDSPTKTQKQNQKSQETDHDKTPKVKQAITIEESVPPSTPSLDPFFPVRYPPPPPSILYSDDQITVSSLHLTIHSFYFPLNTPVTIPLLTITEMETLPSESQTSRGNGSGGVTSWLKYKNWGVSTALTDIWWARDYKPSTVTTPGIAASSRSANKENTPPVVYVVVRVEGEWLRKGFGVQQEKGVKVLKEAWKNVKENERGVRSLRPAVVGGIEDEDGLIIENPGIDHMLSPVGGLSHPSLAENGTDKRRWLSYQNTWTAYPFADDSPQFLAQQQRKGATSKVPRYHQHKAPLRPNNTTNHGQTLCLGPEESCGDEPLFVDNDLNIHEEI